MSQRILFYSHDTIGLGHLERTLTVAEELARRRPSLAMLVATGLPVLSPRPAPDQIDLLRLPTSTHRALYTGLPGGNVSPPPGLLGLASDSGVWHVRAEIVRAAALAFQPDLFLADHQPFGVHNELIPTLTLLREQPRARTAVVLDDVVDDAPSAARLWSGLTADLLRAAYDLVLIRGDRAVFDAAAAYGMPADLAERLGYTGYVARPPDPAVTAVWRTRTGSPLILVTPGGGEDGERLLQTYLAALKLAPLEVASLLVTGPRMPEADQARVREAATGLPRVIVETEIARLVDAIAAADLVVMMGGYSTPAEAMALGKRAIAIPRVKPWPEQRVRMERLAAAGAVTMVHPDEATPERLRAEIERALAAEPPRHTVDCRGLDRHVDLLLDLLDRPTPPRAKR